MFLQMHQFQISTARSDRQTEWVTPILLMKAIAVILSSRRRIDNLSLFPTNALRARNAANSSR
jgi:hypothetical protein